MDDIKFMRMALKLAAKGKGNVEPNPMVGCVIVDNDSVIGEGYHEMFGGPHAEVNALADCRARGNDPARAAMYVTLEPCSHYGKTPPCADAVVDSKIARIVIASLDPSDHVAGEGIKRLEQAGIEVVTGVCEEEARLLNPGFYSFAETGRPWVVLKWAQSIDGFLAYKNTAKHGQWVSNEISRKDANKHRRTIQGILVGVNTIKQDDPQLTIRPDNGRQPLRIVLDTKLTVPIKSQIMNTEIAPTLIVTTKSAYRNKAEKVSEIKCKGPEVVAVNENDGKCDLSEMLEELGQRGIQQLLVEGGPAVLASFFAEQLADEIRVYISSKVLGKNGAASITKHLTHIQPQNLKYIRTKDFEGDTRITGLLIK